GGFALIPEAEKMATGLKLFQEVALDSICSPPSAQVENRTRGERVLFGREPCDHGGYFIDFEKPSTRNSGQHKVDVFLSHLLEDPCLGRRRRDAVDRDVPVGRLLAQGLC